MKITSNLTDDAISTEIGDRLARRRLDLGLTQAEAAEQAGVAKRTLERLESGGSVQVSTLVRVMRVLDLMAALDHALPPAEPGPLDVVRHQGKARQRASRQQKPEDKPWQWAED